MSKENIILIGGGGHCHSVIDVIEQENKYNILGIVDLPELKGKTILGYRVIGDDSDLEQLKEVSRNAIVTIGHIENNFLRVNLFEQLKKFGFQLPIIKSPFSYVSKYATIQEGSVIMHHALVNANVQIGKNCIINTKALIEHDAVVKNHCHISTSSVINGGAIVEEHTFFGSNATSKQSVIINGFIKAGSISK